MKHLGPCQAYDNSYASISYRLIVILLLLMSLVYNMNYSVEGYYVQSSEYWVWVFSVTDR